MPAQHTAWTAEMVRALPDDGKRYEVLDGELCVSPAPSMDHQRVVFHLARLLDSYVRANGLGEVFIAPADVEFSPQRLLQPDVFVIPPTQGKRPRTFKETYGHARTCCAPPRTLINWPECLCCGSVVSQLDFEPEVHC